MRFLISIIIGVLISFQAFAICGNYFETGKPLGPIETLTVHISPGRVSPQFFKDKLLLGAQIAEVKLEFKNKPEDRNLHIVVTGLIDDVNDFSKLVDALVDESGTGTAEFFGPN